MTDSLPAIALGIDAGDPDVMKLKPRNPKESFFAAGARLKVILGGTSNTKVFTPHPFAVKSIEASI